MTTTTATTPATTTNLELAQQAIKIAKKLSPAMANAMTSAVLAEDATTLYVLETTRVGTTVALINRDLALPMQYVGDLHVNPLTELGRLVRRVREIGEATFLAEISAAPAPRRPEPIVLDRSGRYRTVQHIGEIGGWGIWDTQLKTFVVDEHGNPLRFATHAVADAQMKRYNNGEDLPLVEGTTPAAPVPQARTPIYQA